MKSGIYKKAIALTIAILVPAMLLIYWGTQKSTSTNLASEASKKSSSSRGDDADITVSKDPLGKYDPAIDISFVRAIDNDLKSNVLVKVPEETVEENRWLKLYKEQLGINIIYNWTVNGGYTEDAYNQKINVILASGDLPDVITVNSTQLKQLADSHMIEDMTQYYSDYASALTKDIYTQEGASVLASATFDGKLMGIPNVDSSIEAAQYLWIRVDWLKKLGLEPPKSMEELLKISEAFTTKDPDGNGKADTYGIAITKDLFNGCIGLEGFFAGYHSYPGYWQEDSSGKLLYGSVQPETKVALQKLAQMYKTGQLDKEFSIKDYTKVAKDIEVGRVGIEFGEQWIAMYPLFGSFNYDNNADWQAYSLVSAGSEPLKVPLKFRTNLYFAVKKGYTHPEAIVKLINMYLEKNWGATNEFCKYYMPVENSNASVWKLSPVTPFPPYKNLNAFLELEMARQSGDISRLNGEAKVIASNIEAYVNGDTSQWGWDKVYGANGVFHILEQYKNNKSLMVEKFSGAPTKTIVEKKEALDKYEKEEFVKIIMGAASINEFDLFVDNWYKLGGSEITKEVNDWYSSAKK